MSSNKKFNIFIAIKVAGFAASFLREAGVRLHRPIGIALTEVAAIDWLIRDLPIFKHEMISSNLSLSTFYERLCQTHDDILLVHYAESEKSHENIRCLLETTMSGQIEGQDFCAVPIIIFDGFIPDSFLNHLSLILEAGNEESRECWLHDVDKYLESLSQAICCNEDAFKDIVRKSWKDASEITEAKKLLLSAKAVMELALRLRGISEEEKENIINRFNLAIDEWIEFSESYMAKEQIVRLFLKNLRKSVIEHVYNMIEITNARECGDAILYNSYTYYVPIEIFERICALIKFTSSVRIKRCLAECGILLTEGESRIYFSRKLYEKGLSGKRFYWLDRSKIDHETDLSLAEI